MKPELPVYPVIAKLKALLADFPHIRVAAVFGSMAHGTERPDSDIDNEDFVPHQKRILEGRRRAWMNNL